MLVRKLLKGGMLRTPVGNVGSSRIDGVCLRFFMFANRNDNKTSACAIGVHLLFFIFSYISIFTVGNVNNNLILI